MNRPMRSMFFQKLPGLVLFESGKSHRFRVCRTVRVQGVLSSSLPNLVCTVGPMTIGWHCCGVSKAMDGWGTGEQEVLELWVGAGPLQPELLLPLSLHWGRAACAAAVDVPALAACMSTTGQWWLSCCLHGGDPGSWECALLSEHWGCISLSGYSGLIAFLHPESKRISVSLRLNVLGNSWSAVLCILFIHMCKRILNAERRCCTRKDIKQQHYQWWSFEMSYLTLTI